MSTPSAISRAQFVSNLREFKIVDSDRLDEMLATLNPEEAAETAADPNPLAQALVDRKLLTPFQSSLMLQGKTRSLMVAGKYRLVDRLGAGGMGLVYLCEHVRLKRYVALKVLPNRHAQDPSARERFLREAQAAAALKHPNIVSCFDIDSDGGVQYLVMEYVDGVDLERLVAKIGPLDPHRAAYYIAQAAEGLQHASDRGLVHRDIKPANLLVDREGVVRLLDLGLARVEDDDNGITRQYDANSVIGTADYIAPEQAIDSHQVDTRSDIYSLGYTFYFLLAGRAPFKEANVTQKLLMHQMREPTPLDELRPDIPKEMGDVIRRMTAKVPEDRYQTPTEIVQALEAWLRNAPPPLTDAEIPPRSFGSGGSDSMASRRMGSGSMARRAAGLPTAANRRGSAVAAIKPAKGLPKAFMYGVVLVVGGAVIGLAAWRPWIEPDPTPPPIETNSVPTVAKNKNDPKTTQKEKTNPPKKGDPKAKGPTPVPLPGGFASAVMDSATGRPAVTNGSIRNAPTDVVWFKGSDVGKSVSADRDLIASLRRDVLGGTGSAPHWGVIPYALGSNGGASYPNSLMTVESDGTLRTLNTDKGELLPFGRLLDATKHDSLELVGQAELPSGLREINALQCDFGKFTAHTAGSTLKVHSGAILFTGKTAPPGAILGGGSGGRLAIDFNERTGYVTISCPEDFLQKWLTSGKLGQVEPKIHADLVNFGNRPLVVSGMYANCVALASNRNEAPSMVIQGTWNPNDPKAVTDRLFRVTIDADSHLGRAKGTIVLYDAAIQHTGETGLEIDRPLNLAGHVGRISVSHPITANGSRHGTRWRGRISGPGKLVKAGSGQLFLSNPGNNFTGGIELRQGWISLQAKDGTPAGTGPITVVGGTFSGTGKVPGSVTVRGGASLQPGNDGGFPMVLSDSLTFVEGQSAAKKGKSDEKPQPPIFMARLSSNSKQICIYTGAKPVDISPAVLRTHYSTGFAPTADTKIFLMVNQSATAISGTFANASAGSRIATGDKKFSAKISYSGDAAKGTVTGGGDIVLYDWKEGAE